MAEVSEEETPPPAHGEEAQEIQLPAHGEEAQEIQLLLDKVKELEDSIREKDKMKAEILNKIKDIRLKDADSQVCQTELISSQQITDRIIIIFVEGLEKAHRYFDMKEYIRERRYFEELDNGQSGIFDIILEKIEKDNPFGSDEDEIYFAAKAVGQEVNVEGLRKRRAVYENRFNGRDLRHLYTLPNLTTEEKEELLAHMFPCFPNYELEATDSYAHFTPILDLVYQIREKDYVIDEKPEVELQKIEKSHPGFYNDYFVYEEEPMELMEYLAQGLRRCVEEIVFTYAYPRLDMEVSKHMNHLLKAPFCIHPKTGRVCVPINPDDCDSFDPTTVPTLSELLEELNVADVGGHYENEWEKTSLGKYIHFFRSSFLQHY